MRREVNTIIRRLSTNIMRLTTRRKTLIPKTSFISLAKIYRVRKVS